VGSGNHPSLVEPAYLTDAIPAHAGLGAAIGFACVCRNENAQSHQLLVVSPQAASNVQTPVSTNARDAIDCRPATPVGELNRPSAINKMKNAFGEQAQESVI